MKCSICHQFHNSWESCLQNDFSLIEPVAFLPDQIHTPFIQRIGGQDFQMSSYIRSVDNDPSLKIEGRFVRDIVGNLVGELLPGKVITPPHIPSG